MASDLSPDEQTVAERFACRCEPAWTDRSLHAPDCLQELGEDVMDLLHTSASRIRAQVAEEIAADLARLSWKGYDSAAVAVAREHATPKETT